MILILKTGTEDNLLELRDSDGEIKFSEIWPASKLLSEELPGKIEDALKSLNLSFWDVSGIVVFKGPGSFTGLRIGITVVNTIADQVGVPIVGESGEGSSEDWIERGLKRLKLSQNDKIILPEYGGEANITQPRK
jgi:tRNA threonylcarbamoyladenosine biosynthesis protein TsaB